jgi:hypothetical protein
VPRLEVDDFRVGESDRPANRIDLPIRISAESQQPAKATISVIGGTAVAGVDYLELPPTDLVWDDTDVQNLPVTILGNNESQLDRTIVFGVSAGQDLDIVDDEIVLTIEDDEPGISLADATVVEGAGGKRRVMVTATMSPTSTSAVTVDLASFDQSAVAGEDYIALDTTLEFRPRQRTATAIVEVLGDRDPESTETFGLLLSNSSGPVIRDAEATVTIKSDDVVPLLSISDAQLDESGRNMVFTVSLSEPAPQTVRARYTTEDGTAVAPSDYRRRVNRVLSIPRGRTERILRIPIRNDQVVEGDETFQVVLHDFDGVVAGDVVAVGTILDDD